MVVRLFLLLLVALAVSAPVSHVSADAVCVVVEIDGESTADLDEAQVVVGAAVRATGDHALPRKIRDHGAPSPPTMHGVFRPPRAAID
jgi:hypothetical protein